MRIAFISDVHGNLPALISVVEDAISNQVDEFVFVGDYVFDLPFSDEVVRYLMKLKKAHIIKGNKENYIQCLSRENQKDWVYHQMGGMYQTFRDLSLEAYNFLNGLEDECEISLQPNLSIYAVHAPQFLMPALKSNHNSLNFHRKMLEKPFSHQDYLLAFAQLVNSEESRAAIDGINANIIVFGHNHLQAYAYCGDKLIINPGSCGIPLDFIPKAAYTILEVKDGGFNVFEKRVAYDIEGTINLVKKSHFYGVSKIWSDLVFLALRSGRDYFSIFFEIARKIAAAKNETGSFFSNSTWQEARKEFDNRVE